VGFMNYAFEMGSGAVTHMSILLKIGSGIQTLIRGIHRQTDRQHGDSISMDSYLKNKESRPRMEFYQILQNKGKQEQ
jgi:hypothetical protein